MTEDEVVKQSSNSAGVQGTPAKKKAPSGGKKKKVIAGTVAAVVVLAVAGGVGGIMLGKGGASKISLSFTDIDGATTWDTINIKPGAPGITSIIPYRPGWTFQHWTLSASTSSIPWDGNTSGMASGTKIFAYYTPNNYLIQLRYESAPGEFDFMTPINGVFERTAVMDAESIPPARTGYTFVGYSTEENNPAKIIAGTDTLDQSSIILPVELYGSTLYAIWEGNDAVVNFVNNFDTDVNGLVDFDRSQLKVGMEIVLPKFPAGANYTNWIVSGSTSTKLYPGQKITLASSTTVFKLDIGAAVRQYSHRLEDGSAVITAFNKPIDSYQDLCDYQVSKTGAIFPAEPTERWSLTEDGEPLTSAQFYIAIAATGSVTFYPRFVANTVQVRYNFGTGSRQFNTAYTSEYADKTLPFGTVAKLANPTDYTVDGSDFLGYEIEIENKKVRYAPGQEIKFVPSMAKSGIITIYARWGSLFNRLVFNFNGGSNVNLGQPGVAGPNTYTIPGSTSNNYTNVNAQISRTGYKFRYWTKTPQDEWANLTIAEVVAMLSGGGGGSSDIPYFPGENYTVSSQGQNKEVLYAQWETLPYTIEFLADGSTHHQTITSLTFGQAFTFPAAPTKLGNTFSGWQFENYPGTSFAAGSTFSIAQMIASGTLEDNVMTIRAIAQWKAISYDFTLNLGELANPSLMEGLVKVGGVAVGTVSGGAIQLKVAYGATVEIAYPGNIACNTGKGSATFLGFSKTTDVRAADGAYGLTAADRLNYNNGTSITPITFTMGVHESGLTLYANFAPQADSLTYVVDELGAATITGSPIAAWQGKVLTAPAWETVLTLATGYNFVEWQILDAGGNFVQTINPGSTFTYSVGYKLKAVTIAAFLCEPEYDLNYIGDNTDNPWTYTFTAKDVSNSNQSFTLPSAIPVHITPATFTFKCWEVGYYNGATFISQQFANSSTFIVGSGDGADFPSGKDIIVRAMWNIDGHNIEIRYGEGLLDGDLVGGLVQSNFKINAGQSFTLSDHLTGSETPTLGAALFLGYKYSIEGSDDGLIPSGNNIYLTAEELTLEVGTNKIIIYAYFDVATATIVYSNQFAAGEIYNFPQGGQAEDSTIIQGEAASVELLNGANVTFTRPGYNFLGWSTNSAATSAEYTTHYEFAFDVADGTKVNLYPVFAKKNVTITVINKNGVTGDTISKVFGDAADIAVRDNTKTDYTLVGYSFTDYNPAGPEQQVVVSGPLWNFTINRALVWDETTHAYKFGTTGNPTISNNIAITLYPVYEANFVALQFYDVDQTTPLTFAMAKQALSGSTFLFTNEQDDLVTPAGKNFAGWSYTYGGAQVAYPGYTLFDADFRSTFSELRPVLSLKPIFETQSSMSDVNATIVHLSQAMIDAGPLVLSSALTVTVAANVTSIPEGAIDAPQLQRVVFSPRAGVATTAQISAGSFKAPALTKFYIPTTKIDLKGNPVAGKLITDPGNTAEKVAVYEMTEFVSSNDSYVFSNNVLYNKTAGQLVALTKGAALADIQIVFQGANIDEVLPYAISHLNITGTITLPSVKKLNANSVYNLPKVTGLTMPATLTSAIYVGGESAIGGYIPLTSITEQIGNTNFYATGDMLFDKNPAAGNITLLKASDSTAVTTGKAAVNALYKDAFNGAKTIKADFLSGNALVTTINNIGSTVTTIEAGAFAKMSALTTIVVPAQITSIGDGAITAYNNALTSVTVATANATYKSDNNNILNKAGTTLLHAVKETVAAPAGVTTIGAKAFEGLALDEFAVSGSITSIGASAFAHSALESITLADAGVAVGANAFANTDLFEVVLNSDGTPSASLIAELPNNTNSVLELNYTTIASNSFQSLLKSNFGTLRIGSNVAIITGNPFIGASSITKFESDAGAFTVTENIKLSKTGDILIAVANGATVTVANKVVGNGKSIFINPSAVTTVSLIYTGVDGAIMADAFEDCTSLSTIVFQDASKWTGTIAAIDVPTLANIQFNTDAAASAGLLAALPTGGQIEKLTLNADLSGTKHVEIINELGIETVGVGANVSAITGNPFEGATCLKGFTGTGANSISGIGDYLSQSMRLIAYANANNTAVTIMQHRVGNGANVFTNKAIIQKVKLSGIMDGAFIATDAFNGCTALTEIELLLPEVWTGTMGSGMFTGANALTKLTLSSNAAPAAEITAILPASLTTLEINSATFGAALGTFLTAKTNIKTVNITSVVNTIVGNPFDGATGITSFVMGAGVNMFSGGTQLIQTQDKILICYLNGATATGITIGSTSATTIGNGATVFNNKTIVKATTINSSVTKIDGALAGTIIDGYVNPELVIPASVTNIGANSFPAELSAIKFANANIATVDAAAFAGCNMIGNVYLLSDNAPSAALTAALPSSPSVVLILKVEGAWTAGLTTFLNAKTKYTMIEIVGGVTEIGADVFNGATKITMVNIPSSVKTIGNYAFAGTSAMTTINLSSNLSEASFTSNSNIFAGTGSSAATTTVVLGAGVTRVPDWTFGAVSGAAINAITFPASGFTTIGADAFSYTSLGTVTLPSTVTSIGANAFRNSTLTTFSFNGANIQVIEESTFRNTKLTSITIPASVLIIGDYAFAGATSLATVTMASPTEIAELGLHAFGTISDAPYTGASFKIVINNGGTLATVAAFKMAFGWSDYAAKIQ